MTYDDRILLEQLKRERDPNVGCRFVNDKVLKTPSSWWHCPESVVQREAEDRLRARILGLSH